MRSNQWGLIALRGALGALAFFSLFFSLSKIPLTDATLLNNTAPLFVPFLAALVLKTPLRSAICASAGIGFLGVILTLKPSAGLFQLDALPALTSGFFSAVVMILMRMLVTESPKLVIFSYLLIASIAASFFAVPQLPSLPLEAWAPLICVGVIFGSAQMCYTRSFHYAAPTLLAPFSYSFVAVSGLIDWVIWSRTPSLQSAAGIAFIALGGLLTIRYSRRAPAPEKAS